MICGSPENVGGDCLLEVAAWCGVRGPKTSEKSNSAEGDEEGGVMVSFLRLDDKREWRPFCDVETMFTVSIRQKLLEMNETESQPREAGCGS